MSFLRRQPKVDRARYAHNYIGPGNKWGLKAGVPCTIIGTRAGGRRIRTPDGRIWTVATIHVVKAPDPA